VSGERHVIGGIDQLLQVRLLGGFRVERADTGHYLPDWPRRSAKTLTKLLATHPGHALHREQIIDVLWPDVDPQAGLNSFGKALHAARRVLEPDLPRRQDSVYLRLTDCMLVLNTERVRVDVDVFEQLADDAMRLGDVAAYQAALQAYHGELLPEDRYETWCEDRRSSLAEKYLRLLVGLADVYERTGACNEAADRLREVLKHDPMREAVHRQLMRLYARMGTPDQAVRQFHLCAEVLHRELGLRPQPETVSLYEMIRSNQLPADLGLARMPDPARMPGLAQMPDLAQTRAPVGGLVPNPDPFVGREAFLQALSSQLMRRDDARVGLVAISGERGVGKTRLLSELAGRVTERGAVVLRGGSGAHAGQFFCGAFAVALEDHVARLPAAERGDVARRYPALARLVPSLRAGIPVQDPAGSLRDFHLEVLPSIAQLLTELASSAPVLLVLGDLDELDATGLDLVRYLAHLAANVPILMVGSLRDPYGEAGSQARSMVDSIIREQIGHQFELRCLSRRATAQLVQALLPGADVAGDVLAEIYEQSRGNPRFVREIVRGIRGKRAEPGSDPRDVSRASASLPARALALSALRLSVTDKAVHRVLDLVASTGQDEISLGQLRAAAAKLEPPLSAPVLFDALDRALRMHLLEERDGGYAFRHPVVRAALYDSLPRHRREEFRAALAAPVRTAGAEPVIRPELASSGRRNRSDGRGHEAGIAVEYPPGMLGGQASGAIGE
jgi:DNA-binding SARP family transcriptional activator